MQQCVLPPAGGQWFCLPEGRGPPHAVALWLCAATAVLTTCVRAPESRRWRCQRQPPRTPARAGAQVATQATGGNPGRAKPNRTCPTMSLSRVPCPLAPPTRSSSHNSLTRTDTAQIHMNQPTTQSAKQPTNTKEFTERSCTLLDLGPLLAFLQAQMGPVDVVLLATGTMRAHAEPSNEEAQRCLGGYAVQAALRHGGRPMVGQVRVNAQAGTMCVEVAKVAVNLDGTVGLNLVLCQSLAGNCTTTSSDRNRPWRGLRQHIIGWHRQEQSRFVAASG